jgi:hypothetical protein
MLIGMTIMDIENNFTVLVSQKVCQSAGNRKIQSVNVTVEGF